MSNGRCIGLLANILLSVVRAPSCMCSRVLSAREVGFVNE